MKKFLAEFQAFISRGNVLDLAEAGSFHSYCLMRVNFKHAVFDRNFDFGQHIVAIPVYHLDRLAYLAARIR